MTEENHFISKFQYSGYNSNNNNNNYNTCQNSPFWAIAFLRRSCQIRLQLDNPFFTSSDASFCLQLSKYFRHNMLLSESSCGIVISEWRTCFSQKYFDVVHRLDFVQTQYLVYRIFPLSVVREEALILEPVKESCHTHWINLFPKHCVWKKTRNNGQCPK
jgi:hypothetical protein